MKTSFVNFTAPRFVGLVFALAALGMSLLSVNVKADALDLSPAQQQAFGLQYSQAKAVQQIPSLVWSGQVTVPNGQNRVMSASASGELTLLNLSEGVQIQPGQLLGHIKSSDSLDIQRQALATQSALSLAQANLKRDAELADSGVVAQKRLDASRAEVDNLTQQLDQYWQTLTLMGMDASVLAALKQTRKLQTAALSLRAQQPGLVVKLLARSGERVNQNQPIFEWLQLSALWLSVPVSVEQANQLQVGQTVALKDYAEQGEVVMVDGRADATTQSVRVVVALPASLALRPGQVVQAQFLHTAVNAFAVPTSALIQHNNQAWLFVRQGEILHAVAVERLYRDAQQAVVQTDQLNLADKQVVIKGTAALKAVLEAAVEGGE